MTITMSVEIEEGISFDAISAVISKLAGGYTIEQEYLTGNFDCSNCYFAFRRVFPHDDVAAEGVEASWKVSVRGAFHAPIRSLSESSKDIQDFLVGLSIETELRFVLSFQYESVYAVRDEQGLRFVNSMVVEP
ncbi:hypothetical protein ACX0KY_08805 [Pseudomonas extremorientalis]|jgi:hypothetical protein|uniref:hypothetical protein n=1 Tax=Pseudomonas extremorientalis TaxID=169669 RepID=UPI00211C2392|nr:hypothetical protein [Pseudomonas extremorientalis]UUN87089.1 hypothetical protein LUU92_19855 [Pseudomonas extremorientalis]